MRDGSPVGFIQYYNAYQIGDGWWENEPIGTFGVDLMIGTLEHMGKGLGPKILEQFIELLQSREPTAKTIIIDPNPDNHRAIRSFEKAGFKPEGEISTPGGRALLMRRTLRTK